MTPILHSLRDGILTVTINRPDKRNALNLETLSEFDRVLDRCEADPDVRALVLRGSAHCFCAGADLKDLAVFGPDEVRRFHDLREKVFARIEAFPAPTVAMIEGYALGTGLLLALTADFRVASADAVLGIPSSRLGVTESYVFLRRLLRIVGPARARYLVLSAERVSAPEALALGLVERAVEASEFERCVAALVEGLSRNAPKTMRRAKQVLAECEIDPELVGVADPVLPLLESVLSEEMKSGTRNFLERK